MGIVLAILATSFMIGIFAYLMGPRSGRGANGQAAFLWGGVSLVLSIVTTIAIAIVDGIARPEWLVCPEGLFGPRLDTGQLVLIFLYEMAVDYGGAAVVGLILFLFVIKTSKQEPAVRIAKQRNWRAEVR